MYKYYTFLGITCGLIGLALLYSCGKSKISQEKMAQILWDIQKEDQSIYHIKMSHSVDDSTLTQLNQQVGEEILKKYDITRQDFKSSLDKIQEDPAQFLMLMEEIKKLAEQDLQKSPPKK